MSAPTKTTPSRTWTTRPRHLKLVHSSDTVATTTVDVAVGSVTELATEPVLENPRSVVVEKSAAGRFATSTRAQGLGLMGLCLITIAAATATNEWWPAWASWGSALLGIGVALGFTPNDWSARFLLAHDRASAQTTSTGVTRRGDLRGGLVLASAQLCSVAMLAFGTAAGWSSHLALLGSGLVVTVLLLVSPIVAHSQPRARVGASR